jgi:starch phosphorylase
MKQLKRNMEILSLSHFGKPLESLNLNQLHYVLSKSILGSVAKTMQASNARNAKGRRAYYFSAEFLVGRAIYNNLLCTGLLSDTEKLLENEQKSITNFEEIEDAALGNGGLGRLAACFLDSGATLGLPLDGYGIRYRFGLFKQYFLDGFQKETLDDWSKYGDPWSQRNESDTVLVEFSDYNVKAVPYDMPIIGYGGKHISNLRLWQAEPIEQFDFTLFDSGKYEKCVTDKNRAEDISRVLYPNDNTLYGKLLRLRQQYFFCSASLQDIIKKFKLKHTDFAEFPEFITIQLNDTHPVISIPELIRLLMLEGVDFDGALEIAKGVFNYTNHTVLPEALEKWDMKFIKKISPEIAAMANSSCPVSVLTKLCACTAKSVSVRVTAMCSAMREGSCTYQPAE